MESESDGAWETEIGTSTGYGEVQRECVWKTQQIITYRRFCNYQSLNFSMLMQVVRVLRDFISKVEWDDIWKLIAHIYNF